MTEISYVGKIQDSLFHSLTLVDLPCQHVDGYNKPEIEPQNSRELLLDPIEIRKNEQERTLIERSVNSVRINVQVWPTVLDMRTCCLQNSCIVCDGAPACLNTRRSSAAEACGRPRGVAAEEANSVHPPEG